MTAFTRVGCGVLRWMRDWPLDARLLWFGLYISEQARGCPPGLWVGGPHMMGESAHMTSDEAYTALRKLIDMRKVEFDSRNAVLRMCELPDAGEFPKAGSGIKSWWTRFTRLPACEVRDAHIPTLWWIVEAGAIGASKSVSADHRNAWNLTFGTVQVPIRKHRGVRSLDESDTGTAVQPSLFGSPKDTHVIGGVIDRSSNSYYPVDNSDSMHQHNKNNSPTLYPGYNGIRDQGSGIILL